MMYGNYGERRYDDYRDGEYERYGRRGVPGTGRGRYRAHGRAEEPLREMNDHYGNYSESRSAAESGNYGAEQDSMKALEYMLESVCQFMDMLMKDAGSQEEAQMIKKYARKIGEM